MEFEWDAGKSTANFVTRGFDFAFAAQIFAGPILEAIDDREDYGELRIKTLGEAQGLLLVVVYTDRAGRRRIISARPANRRERAQWLSRFA